MVKLGSGSRVVIVDENTGVVRSKTAAQIVQENEEVLDIMYPGRNKVNEKEKDEALKEAGSNDAALQALLAKKSAEKVEKQAAEATEVATDEEAPSQEAVQEEAVGLAQEPAEEALMAPPAPPAPEAPKKVIEMQSNVSLSFGVVGVGQAGSKLAKVFYDLGYDACAINTARQDLALLDLPEKSKYFIDYSVGGGGAGRDLEVGKAAIEDNYDDVRSFVESEMEASQVLILCVSGGGGSGSGGATTMVDMLFELGQPVIVMYVLPGSSDDSQSKHNAIKTLAALGKMASTEKINSLILVDNAKIELAYPDLSQAAFWKTANNAIVEPLHVFNSVSARPSNYETLDSMDFAQTLLNAGNCVLFGSNKVSKEFYESDETALVEAIIDNLERGLLAGGFDLTEAQTVGILITAKQDVLENIPHKDISYVFKYISSEYDSARSFKGVYAVPAEDDDITVHFVFSGLGLPNSRVSSLKAEAEKHMDTLANKKKSSSDRMTIDMGKDDTTSAADEMMSKIKRKKGAIGKLMSKSKKVNRRR